MKRRGNRGAVEIPAEIMAANGDHREDWAAWCEQVGYRKVDFLREEVRRREAERRRLWSGGPR